MCHLLTFEDLHSDSAEDVAISREDERQDSATNVTARGLDQAACKPRYEDLRHDCCKLWGV